MAKIQKIWIDNDNSRTTLNWNIRSGVLQKTHLQNFVWNISCISLRKWKIIKPWKNGTDLDSNMQSHFYLLKCLSQKWKYQIKTIRFQNNILRPTKYNNPSESCIPYRCQVVYNLFPFYLITEFHFIICYSLCRIT
jgi:hypothetical protein